MPRQQRYARTPRAQRACLVSVVALLEVAVCARLCEHKRQCCRSGQIAKIQAESEKKMKQRRIRALKRRMGFWK